MIRAGIAIGIVKVFNALITSVARSPSLYNKFFGYAKASKDGLPNICLIRLVLLPLRASLSLISVL